MQKIYRIWTKTILFFILIFLIIENLAILKKPQSTINISEIKIWMPNISQDIDLESNNSLQKYVSEHTKVPREYVPASLQIIKNNYVQQSPYDNHQLVFQARNGLYKLAEAFHTTFNTYLYLNSSYRPRTAQYYLLKEGCSNLRCASIGASEHQLGLAIDIAVYSDTNKRKVPLQWKYFQRMKDNAYKYWYINTYQKWITIDGRINEPRHRRYVWVKLAKYLHYKELSFAEFYMLKKHKPKTIKIDKEQKER